MSEVQAEVSGEHGAHLSDAKKRSLNDLLTSDLDALLELRTTLQGEGNSDELETALAGSTSAISSFKDQEKLWKKMKFSNQDK